MKTLVFSPHLPEPDESDDTIRAIQIVRLLSQAHEVHALCFLEKGVSPEDLRREYGDYPESLILVSEPDLYQIQQSFDAAFQRVNPEVIIFEATRPQELKFPKNIPRIADVLRIEHMCLTRSILALEMLFGKTLGAIEYERLKRAERKTLESCTACIARSEADADYMRSFMPDANVILARDGVDVSVYVPGPEAPVPSVAVGVDMCDPCSVDSVIDFATGIWPRILNEEPRSELYILGFGIPDSLKNAVKPGIVVEDKEGKARERLRSCWVYTAPIEKGGGPDARILRAMAAAKPIMTTPYGCRGVVLLDEESALIRTEPDEIAREIIRLLRDTNLRRKFGSSARNIAVQLYDWSITLEPILECTSQLAIKRTR